jgi:hypothetical protein
VSWYEATVSHDRIRAGQVVWLEDTEDVAVRLVRGYLLAADEPDWNKSLPEEKQWPMRE